MNESEKVSDTVVSEIKTVISENDLKKQVVRSEGEAELTIKRVRNADTLEEELNIAHDESLGAGGVAYLLFGIPGTPMFTLMDLNHLPEGIKVRTDIWRHNRKLSSTVFNNSSREPGVEEEANPEPSSEIPAWAFALAKSVAFNEPLDFGGAKAPGPIQELLDNAYATSAQEGERSEESKNPEGSTEATAEAKEARTGTRSGSDENDEAGNASVPEEDPF